MSATDLIAKLDRVKEKRSGNWVACCPAHKDKHPSMTIAELSDGRVLVHCFAGCSVEEILNSVGLDFDALYPEKAVGERMPPIRRPFNAHDVLECLAEEALLVSVAASGLRNGMPLTDTDHDRLWTACERLEEGRRLANG